MATWCSFGTVKLYGDWVAPNLYGDLVVIRQLQICMATGCSFGTVKLYGDWVVPNLYGDLVVIRQRQICMATGCDFGSAGFVWRLGGYLAAPDSHSH